MLNDAVASRLTRLRTLMKEHGVDAYVVPGTDPHQSEYVADHWKCREWLSGFSGSAGTVAVMQAQAGLWTDGRYFIQAEQELKGSGIDLFKMQMPDVPALIDWLAEQVPEGGTVAVDGRQISVADADRWRSRLENKGIALRLDLDLISNVWDDRPALPAAPVQRHAVEYAGRSAAEKLAEIRAAMKEKEAGCYLLTSLDDIAWLFNIRGGDIPHCPVAMAYAMVSNDRVLLYVNASAIDSTVRASLDDDRIELAPYNEITEALAALDSDVTVVLDDKRVNALLRESIPLSCRVIYEPQLTALPKARKNETELQQWDKVHAIDGAAMVRFWKWLEEELPKGGITECSAADQLEAIRRSSPDCIDLSFTSISGYGPNAAIVHYAPELAECLPLEERGLYLIDSGGQYFGGTTDITRTLSLGEMTDEERTDYTLVLKGLISLSSARFRKGAAGINLDVLARQPLWAHGIDYSHGTGHGVGHCLNVHEGPHSISPHRRSSTPLEPGMVVTIEPGVYREGRHGIRIENMVVVEEDCESESGSFYRFRILTLCPIDTAPLKKEMLSAAELEWLNGYHETVRRTLAPHLSPEEYRWLEQKTQPEEIQC